MTEPRPTLGVNYSMLYSIQTLPAVKPGGTKGDVGDKTMKPRNMNVRTNIGRSLRSAANTTYFEKKC